MTILQELLTCLTDSSQQLRLSFPLENNKLADTFFSHKCTDFRIDHLLHLENVVSATLYTLLEQLMQEECTLEFCNPMISACLSSSVAS